MTHLMVIFADEHGFANARQMGSPRRKAVQRIVHIPLTEEQKKLLLPEEVGMYHGRTMYEEIVNLELIDIYKTLRINTQELQQ